MPGVVRDPQAKGSTMQADEAEIVARLRMLFEAAAKSPERFEALAEALVDELSDDALAGAYIDAALPGLQTAPGPGDPPGGDEDLTLAQDGTVLTVGAAVQRRLGLRPGDGVGQLGIGAAELAALLARIAAHGERRGILSIWPAQANRLQFLLARQPDPDGPLILSPFEVDWPAALDVTLSDLFGLSRREQEILRQLYNGHDPQSIADADGRALGTVRQQVKSILSKLGLGNRARVQAFLVAASIALQPHPTRPGGDPVAARGSLHRHVMRRPGSEPLGLRSFGEPGGMPCLLVHGALYGLGALDAEREIAAALGLHVFGPERRGYGTSPVSDWKATARGNGEHELCEALDHFLPQGGAAVVLAQDTGLLPALALARARPKQVAAIVAVSATPPLRTWADSAGMPPQQRVFALTMQRAPGAADALVTLGLARMRRLGAQAWPEAVFAGVARDVAVARAPRNLDAVMRAYAFNTEQAAHGFRIDMARLYRDWGDLPESLRCPVVFLHGAENRTVQPLRLMEFTRRFAQGRVEVVEDAGHTLALSHPALALRHVFALSWQGFGP